MTDARSRLTAFVSTWKGQPRSRRAAVLAVATLGVCLLVGALVWLLPGQPARQAGPGGGPVGTPATSTAQTTGTPGTGPTASGGATARPGSSRPPSRPPTADPAGDKAGGFLTEVGAIDPGLVADRDRTLGAAQSTCQDIRAGKPQDVLVRDARQRFGGNGVAVDDVKASLIVDAVRNHLCTG